MRLFSLALVGLLSIVPAAGADEPKPLRAGIIGLDTSHVPAFTKIFNSPDATGDVAGIRVVVGYPGGTDYGPSRDRVAKFTQGMRDAGVEIVETIPELLAKCDVVLLESVDGRIHLEEAIPVIKAGKPVFIDKPVAASLVDAITIFELAKKHNVPCFSSSSLRFSTDVQGALKDEAIGEVVGAAAWGPCDYQAGTPDLCFYGIHSVESLFTLMGSGCERVTRTQTERGDEVVGVWKGDRIGSFRGLRKGGAASFGAVVYGTKGIAPLKTPAAYKDLCMQIGRFFRTHQPPVDAATTIEIFAFMEAADESKRQGGKPVTIADVMAKAQAEAAKKLAEIEAK